MLEKGGAKEDYRFKETQFAKSQKLVFSTGPRRQLWDAVDNMRIE